MIWLYMPPPYEDRLPLTKEQERRLLWVLIPIALFDLAVLFFGPH